MIANSPKVNLRYLKDVEIYLEEDIRMDIEDFRNMDVTIFEHYAQTGKKAKSVTTLIKFPRLFSHKNTTQTKRNGSR